VLLESTGRPDHGVPPPGAGPRSPTQLSRRSLWAAIRRSLVEFNTDNAWDWAAGSLLVTEAGGLVTDMLGEDAYLQNGSIIAAAPKVLPQMLQTLSPHMHRQKAARGVARAG